MLVEAEFGTGQVLWSIVWFFVFFTWVWLVIRVFAEIIRSDLSGVGKAVWTLAILVLPFLGVFMYLIVNGDGMSQHSVEPVQHQGATRRAWDRSARSDGPAAELRELAELHSAGQLNDAEFEEAKARVLRG